MFDEENENINDISSESTDQVPDVPAVCETNGKTPDVSAAEKEPAVPENEPEEPVRTYGVIYSPVGDGSSYTSRAYSSDSAAVRQDNPAAAPVKKKNSGGGKIALIAAIAVLCVLLSGLAAFAGTYFAKRYALGTNVPPSSEGDPTDSSPEHVVVGIADDPGEATGTTVQTISVPHGTKMTIVDTVRSVKDTVVEITTETVQKGNPFFGDYITSGAGSGVIISSDGYIITNNHVIEGATSITVRLTDGTEYEAELIGTDEDYDVAIIKVDAKDKKLPYAVIGNSDNLEVGEEIIVIGNPLGQLGGTVTNGIISAKEREISVNGETMTLLQTNAAVNPGNSGGGMFNLFGELVGVINAKSSGENIEGLGFAIPANTAWFVAQELIEHGYVRGKPTLGVTIVDVTSQFTAMRYFNSYSLGVYVYEANEASGFRYGDRIITCNGTEIASASQITSLIKSLKVGDTISVTVVREGKTVDVSAVLIEKVPTAEPKK